MGPTDRNNLGMLRVLRFVVSGPDVAGLVDLPDPFGMCCSIVMHSRSEAQHDRRAQAVGAYASTGS